MKTEAGFRLAGVMGWPVAHSLSPCLHGYWLNHYAIQGSYVPLPVAPDALERALRALPMLGFRGCNLTLPHKEKALALVDTVDDTARQIGAINTIMVKSDGALHGTNTDAEGFLAHLQSVVPAPARWQRAPMVVGAGGVARAIIYALLQAGCPHMILTNRTMEKAQALAAHFGDAIRCIAWEDRHDALADASLLVNATSLGLKGQPDLSLRLDALPHHAPVYDTIYTPLRTSLLQQAEARGHSTLSGLGMLMHQAVGGFEAWYGIRPEPSAALMQHLIAQLVEGS